MRLVSLPALALAAACSAIAVETDYDPSVDFAEFESWAWLPRKEPVQNPLEDERIRAAVEAEMDRRGFRRADARSADFLLARHAAVRRRLDVHTIYHSYGYYPHDERVADTYVTEYDEGTLLLDVVEPASRRLIWRGTARGAVGPRASPEQRARRTREAVAKLLDRFPP